MRTATQFTLSGEGAELFSVDNSGNVALTASIDFETQPSYQLTAIASNDSSSSDSASVTITIEDIADVKPVLTDFSGGVEENSQAGTMVGKMTFTETGDSDITAITLSGSSSENFTVNPDGTISVAAAATLDYESLTNYSLLAIAENTAGKSEENQVVIEIINVIDTVPVLIAFETEIGARTALGTGLAAFWKHPAVKGVFSPTG